MAARLSARPPKLETIGARQGEKLFEELLSIDEMSRAVELERLLVVLSPNAGQYDGGTREVFASGKSVTREWHSGKDSLMSREEISKYLEAEGILAPYLETGALA
jgi:FlaA1/EpsC-like NDP-sugar epimerase